MFGQQMGMALAHVADPVSGGQSSLLGTFCNVLGTLVFFAVGGHLMMLRALRHSFDCWPLGAFASAQFLRHMSVSAGAQAFVMAFQLAAPLLLLAFMVSLTMAVMARLVPQMNVLIVGFPLRIGVGLVGLTLFLPILVRYSAHVSRVLVEYMTGVVTGA
jgi:flagellar biosynthetic protein FliR